jgi:hypothetical protein
MFKKIVRNDKILGQGLFLDDEVQYNLVHRICESKDSTCLKSIDEELIFAQSMGHKAWLWIAKSVTEEKKVTFVQMLLDQLNDNTLPGITGSPDTVKLFAENYLRRHSAQYHVNMSMESYYCPKILKPSSVDGNIQQATRQNVEIIAKFLAGFSEGAYGVKVDPASQIPAAEEAVKSGNLFLWMVGDHPVSMAKVAHRSPRHARVSAVYTPLGMRKKGYASAVVAELCSILESEGLMPMLYADLKNPDSNKVYKNIGFIEGGIVTDIKFDYVAKSGNKQKFN